MAETKNVTVEVPVEENTEYTEETIGEEKKEETQNIVEKVEDVVENVTDIIEEGKELVEKVEEVVEDVKEVIDKVEEIVGEDEEHTQKKSRCSRFLSIFFH
jgi:uncharacterized protein YoxC